MKFPPILQTLVAAAFAWAFFRFVPIWKFDGILIVYLIWGFGAAGIAFVFVALNIFRVNKTTIDPLDPSKAEHLVVTGVYRITRNPMYVSMVLLLIAWCLYLGDLIAFLSVPLFVVAITELQIKSEERALSRKFGDEYQAYKLRVRRWL